MLYSSQRASDTSRLPQLITFAGLIGAGKTTLADKLGAHLGAKVHHEEVETNELLPAFYSDMKRWGFTLQASLLTQRHAQLQRINWDTDSIHVEDRFMDEDHVFATTLLQQGNMTEMEFGIYEGMVQTYGNHARRPDLVVFLDVSVDTCIQRIQQRGRQMEQHIPREYLETLHAEYRKFIRHLSKRIPVIKLTWEEYQSAKDVATMIVDRWHTKCFNVME